MTNTRRIRLLKLATKPHGMHKRYYSQYVELMYEGLVGWQLGIAFLTPKGEEYLKDHWANEVLKYSV